MDLTRLLSQKDTQRPLQILHWSPYIPLSAEAELHKVPASAKNVKRRVRYEYLDVHLLCLLWQTINIRADSEIFRLNSCNTEHIYEEPPKATRGMTLFCL